MTGLKPGRSKAIFGYNVKKLVAAGYHQKQAEVVAEQHAAKTEADTPVLPEPLPPEDKMP
jgi:hypothetical protein